MFLFSESIFILHIKAYYLNYLEDFQISIEGQKFDLILPKELVVDKIKKKYF